MKFGLQEQHKSSDHPSPIGRLRLGALARRERKRYQRRGGPNEGRSGPSDPNEGRSGHSDPNEGRSGEERTGSRAIRSEQRKERTPTNLKETELLFS